MWYLLLIIVLHLSYEQEEEDTTCRRTGTTCYFFSSVGGAFDARAVQYLIGRTGRRDVPVITGYYISYLFTILTADSDALAELSKSIEHFLGHLNIRIPPTVAITEVVGKIPAEVLSVLALATKQIQQG